MSSFSTRITSFFILFLGLAVTPGCSPGTAPMWSQAKPETLIKFDPVSKTLYFHNSKDVDLKMERVVIEADGTKLTMEGLSVIDNASSVRTANVAQLDAIGPITTALMQPWRDLAARLPVGPPLAPTPPSETGIPDP